MRGRSTTPPRCRAPPAAVAGQSAAGHGSDAVGPAFAASAATAVSWPRPARRRRRPSRRPAQPVIVKTDLLEVELNTAGGDIRRVTLFKVFSALDRTKPLTLLAPDPKQYFVTQTGLLGEGLPSHKTTYTVESNAFNLADGQDQLEVRLVARDAAGVEVVKKFALPPRQLRDRRELRGQERRRQADRAVRLFPVPARRQPAEPGRGADERLRRAWRRSPGPPSYTDEAKFVKVDFKDIDKGKQSHVKKAKDGWIAHRAALLRIRVAAEGRHASASTSRTRWATTSTRPA